MLALYLLALGFGSTLILASLLLGGSDHGAEGGGDHGDADHGDVDHDAHVDHAGDADHDAHVDHDAQVDHGPFDKELGGQVWLPFLSLRFWTFGMAAFGLAGALLTLLSVPDVLTALTAVVGGLGIGTVAAFFFKALKKDSVSGDTQLDRFAGEEARVVVAVRPGQPGKIVVQTLAGRVEMMATTRDAQAIDVGSAVIVAEVRGGVADVSRLDGGNKKDRDRARAAQERGTQGRTEV